jgi:hypothetical protein
MQLKQFKSRKDLVDYYPFTTNKKNEIGYCWFALPLSGQLKYFKNGLGRITYFKTVERDLEKHPYDSSLEKQEYQVPYFYEMIVDYILLSENLHDPDCNCGCEDSSKAELLKLDGFDDCYLGLGETYGQYPALIYDKSKIIEQLRQDGMDEEEAQEYFEYNILGSFFGEKMPIFLDRIPLEELNHS